MGRTRNLADLLDSNGDVKSAALDNVPPADLVNDTTPQLGGNLDLNNNNITGTGSIDITGTVAAGSLTLGSQVLSVDANGNLVGDDNLQGFTYHPRSRTDAQTSVVKQFTITGNTTGNFSATSLGYPSGVKAIFCTGWVQIDGYGGTNGADHATYHFGQSAPDGAYASSGNISTAFDAQFSFAHDGDYSASTGDYGEYGMYWNGLVPVNSNGSIYYNLGNGYSGGTHYISLIMNGYII